MASIHIFQNKQTQEIVLCPFAFCKEFGGGSVATGALIRLSSGEFLRHGVEIVTREFELFYTRDSSTKSELYEEMTKSERKKFFSQHKKVTVSWPIKNEPVNVYIGPNDHLYGKLAYPFDKTMFANYILDALSEAE
jgi:hypothetical protein